tara:strand:- start:6154 stop:6345 length:192 start_codon:yes stop_codon:yes gene_type:complete
MNKDNSIDTILSNEYFNDNLEEENARLSIRRNAVKPYIPIKKESSNEVEIKQSKNTFFCCKLF